MTSQTKGHSTSAVSEQPRKIVARARPEQTDKRTRRQFPVPEFKINLDLPPEERLMDVTRHFHAQLTDVYKHFSDQQYLDLAKRVTGLRGPEDPELMGEINGIAKASGIPAYFIQSLTISAEIESLKGPWAYYLHSMNKTLPSNEVMFQKMAPSDFFEGLSDFQELFSVTGVGCTGVIAMGVDGSVYHARNLDTGPGSGKKSSFAHWLQNITYNAVFTKGGKEIFTGQTNAIIPGVYTGIRRGSNGYGVELNSRYLDHGMQGVMKNLFTEHRKPISWIIRKIMENNGNYEHAVQAFSTTPYPSPAFTMISGVKKGTVLARDPDGLAYKWDLGKKQYMVLTNYDYVNSNKKAWLDTVALNNFGHYRRLAAEKILNASKSVDADLLQRLLNDDAVLGNETIFQAIINVEKGIYNTTLPHCLDC